MRLESQTFESIEVWEKFEDLFRTHCEHVGAMGACSPIVSPSRVSQAHLRWKDDLKRNNDMNMPDGTEADHFKRAAFITYWLRRTQPILGWKPWHVPCGTPAETKGRNILFQYGSEATAFLLGFYLAYAFEQKSIPANRKFLLDHGYLLDVCYVMKVKNVSPHALYLLFKSLFYARRT